MPFAIGHDHSFELNGDVINPRDFCGPAQCRRSRQSLWAVEVEWSIPLTPGPLPSPNGRRWSKKGLFWFADCRRHKTELPIVCRGASYLLWTGGSAADWGPTFCPRGSASRCPSLSLIQNRDFHAEDPLGIDDGWPGGSSSPTVSGR